MNLSEAQYAHLAAVRAAHAAEVAAAATLEARIRATLAAELAAVRQSTALAARRAADAGVPIRRIGIDGLGTSSWATVRAVLALTDATPADDIRERASGFRAPDDAERRAAGIDASEYAVHMGARLAVRIDGGQWATVTPDGTPAGAADAETVARLEAYAA